MSHEAKYATRRGVELVKQGEWPALTGPADITIEKMLSMLRASSESWWSGAPGHRGHLDGRFDGEPALGWVKPTGIKIDENGTPILVGDIEQIPVEFDEHLENAYANRSIEWIEEYKDPEGKVWPAVLTGLAYLGAHLPGVDGLARISPRDELEQMAASKNADVLCAYLGKDQAINEVISTLNTSMLAQSEKISHDELNAKPTESSEDVDMTDTLDQRVRELLDLSAEDDVLAALEALKVKAEGDNGDPNEGEPEPEGDDEPKEDEPQNEPERETVAKSSEEMVTTSKAFLEELMVKAEAGAAVADQFKEQAIDNELKAASRANKLYPCEYDSLKKLLMSDNKETVAEIRQMLSKRPAVMPMAERGTAEEAQAQSVLDTQYEQVKALMNIGGNR